MTPTDTPTERRHARRRRTARLRKRIAVGAVTLFGLVWAALFVQMATGHDPALNRQRSSTTTSVTAREASTTSSAASSSAPAPAPANRRPPRRKANRAARARSPLDSRDERPLRR